MSPMNTTEISPVTSVRDNPARFPRQPGQYPASASQRRLWFLNRLDVSSPAYNMPRVWRVAGPLDLNVLAGAVAGLIARHEQLRTNFLLKDGVLVQIVATPQAIDLPLLDLTGHPNVEHEMARIVKNLIGRPFDLERDPMLRTTVVRLNLNDHAVVFVTHHIASDRWSSSIFHRELGALYESLSDGGSCDLDELPAQYCDYSEQEREYLESEDAQCSLAYWTSHLAGVPSLLQLPHDRPRPAIQAHRGSQHSFSIPEDPVNKLRKIGQRERVTLSNALLAAFQTLLFRTSQQARFVIGVPVAGRSRSEFEGLVGNFVNTLPLPADLAGDPSFAQIVKTASRTMLESLDHQSVPVEHVIDALRPERSLSYAPVFQVMFNYANRQEDRLQVAGLTINPIDVHNDTSLQDLTLYVTANGSQLQAAFEYDADLFDAVTIDRFAQRFLRLIDSIAASPDLPVSRLEWIPDSEHAVVQEWNATTRPFSRDSGIHQLVESKSKQAPDAIAAVCNGQSITRGQLEERANRAANFLLNLGAGPDTRIAIAMERSIDLVVGLLAILKTGAAYVPLELSQPRARLQSIVDDANTELLLTHQRAARGIGITGPQLVLLDRAVQDGSSDPPPDRQSASTPAYLIYTSGTTGKPKGVLIPHRAVVNVLESMAARPGLTEADTLLAITPLSFDISGLEIFLPLVVGARLEIASRETASDPAALSRKLRESGATVMQATPATWRMLVESGWKGNSKLSAWCGGEALPRDLADPLLERVGSLWNLYGPTETTIWSTVSMVAKGGGLPSIGSPIANTKLHLLDANLQPVPIGVAGELYISGAGLAEGYWKQPELTNERFPANPFDPGARMYMTGDLARWLSDGKVEYFGRLDHQVKIRGFRIELGEIEAVLSRHNAVSQCVVTARDAGPGDKLLAAYFVSHDGSMPDAGDLRMHLKNELPDYMIPSAFVHMEKLPLTPNGKIDRKALPPPEERPIEARHDFVAPRDALEQGLARAWSKVLKVKQVGLRDNFFDIGGNSLAAVQLLSEIQKLTGRTLPLATLFQASTVEAFAEILRRDGWTPSWSSLVPIQPLGSKNPLFLVHGAEGNVLLYRQVTRYLGPDQPVYGLQSQGLNGDGRFDETIRDMAARYVKELRAVQPQGPYFLGGYCLGGIIAFEIAQQLNSMGEKVERVILLDTYNTSAASDSTGRIRTPVVFLQNLWFHAANVFCAQSRDRRAFLIEKIDVEMRRLGIRLRAGYHAFRRTVGQSRASSYPHLMVKKINDRAALEYKPQPYTGRVAVIRPKAYFVGRTSPTLGWGEVVPDSLEVHELPVYPKGMLSEPFCRSLAETLKNCLQHT